MPVQGLAWKDPASVESCNAGRSGLQLAGRVYIRLACRHAAALSSQHTHTVDMSAYCIDSVIKSIESKNY